MLFKPSAKTRSEQNLPVGLNAVTDPQGPINPIQATASACTGCHVKPVFTDVGKNCADCHADIHRGQFGANCAQCHTVLGWQVEDIEAAVDWFEKRGVVFEKYPFVQDRERGIWTAPGGDRVAWFKDPDGNVLSVSEHASAG